MNEKYNLESLIEINGRFCSDHTMMEEDVKKANKYVNGLESRLSQTNKPRTGDIIRYTTNCGRVYEYAHIDTITNDKAYVCLSAMIPFAFMSDDETKICYSTSGGPWEYVEVSKLTHITTEEKIFKTWGNCGVSGNGAISFDASVNVWEYKESPKINN